MLRKVLGLRQLHELIGRGRTLTAFRMWTARRCRAGDFPAPVKIGPNSVAWYADEVEAWLQQAPRVHYRPEAA